MMKHANVAVFVPHNGCPHQCSFCSQKSITGQSFQPQAQDVVNAVEIAVKSLGEKTRDSEIAFFGGSFTAIDRAYMLSLLDAAAPYLDRFKGIRISTRPDCIDNEILDLLKQYKISAVELGVQSMSNIVLKANRRGHTAEDVCKSARLIKANGISLGLQMMTNLYQSAVEDDIYTARRIIALKPDTVRIYPTVVLSGTELARLYQQGSYIPYSLQKSVEECALLLKMFRQEKINVIRVGLHSGGEVDSSFIAGAYHPAFRELCESKIMIDSILDYLKEHPFAQKQIEIHVAPSDVSVCTGQHKRNIRILSENGYTAVVRADTDIKKHEFLIKPR